MTHFSPKILAIAVLLGLPAGHAGAQEDPVMAWDIDWVPLEALTPQQREAMQAPLCCGRYIEPPVDEFTAPLQSPVPAGTLHAQASAVDYDDSGIVRLRGNVRARQLDAVVYGDRAEFDRLNDTFRLEGNVRVREPGVLLAGEQGFVDNQAGRMRLEQASYVLHEQSLRGTAETILYTDSNGIVTIDNGRYSRCEPGSNDWVLEAGSISLDQAGGRGIARHARLKIRDIPILYTPYISFPINDERTSGFLPASIGSTNSGGLDLTLPYYFNLAPNYDATYTPRFMSDRGLQHGLEVRHLGRRTENEINLGYLASDDLYDAAERAAFEEALESGEPPDGRLVSPPTEERWYVNADHSGRYGERWSTLIDYQSVSDEDYFRDFSTQGVQVSAISYLRRRGELRYNGDAWRLQAGLENYQVIDPDLDELRKPLALWPRLSLEGRFRTDFDLDYGIETEYSHFDRGLDREDFSQAQIDNGLLVNGGRLAATPWVGYRWSTPGVFVNPELRYHYRAYQLDDQAVDASDSPTVGVFSASVDTGLIFDRSISLFDEDYIQTLEPRLYYLYNEYEDQSELPEFDSTRTTFSYNQLFRSNSFSGLDRISNANQMTAAIGTRFFSGDGSEKASASVGQIFYFEDRRVTLDNRITDEETRDTSNIAAQLDYRFSDDWRISSYLEWNAADNTFDVGSFQFQYQSDINRILNLSLRFRDDERGLTAEGFDQRIIQTDLSAAWPMTPEWGAVIRFNYDHANERTLEHLAGFEYDNCCWNLRFVYREWVDRFDQQRQFNPQPGNSLALQQKDHGLFLQFELKGLGSIIGGSVGEILARNIRGYRQ